MPHRFASWSVVGLVVAIAATSPPTLGSAAPHGTAPTKPATCGADRVESGPPDFNHDGDSDFVVGLPGARGGVGAIEVVERGHKPVIYQPGTHGIPRMPAGAHFGSTTDVFDANGDQCDDLLVSAPGLPVNGRAGAGGVTVLFGGTHGMTSGPVLTQADAGVPGAPVVDGHFGTALFAGGYSPPGVQGFPPPVGNLVDVGVPGATVMSTDSDPAPLRQAGEVVSFYLSPRGRVVKPSEFPVSTMPFPTVGAHFGTAIGQDYVTAPDASNGTLRHAGYIRIFTSDFYGHQAGERLGTTASVGPPSNTADELYGLYVGAPGYRVGSHRGAGGVERFNVEFDAPAVYPLGVTTQASHGVPGPPQTGARFGAAISIGYRLVGSTYDAEVAIGAPGATVNGKHGAGRVDVNSLELIDRVNGFVSKAWTSETQATPHVPGAPRSGAGFGSALADFLLHQSEASPLRLVIGIPGARVGVRRPSGEVLIKPVGLDGLTKRLVRVLRRAGGPHAGDDFGDWVNGEIDSDVG